MTLYYVWWEDSEVTTDTYKQTTNLVHETGFGPGGDDGDGNGGAGNSSVAVPKKGSGKNGAKGIGKGGRGKGKNIGIPQPPPVKKEKKEKKEKTPNQLARNVSRLCFVIARSKHHIFGISCLPCSLPKLSRDYFSLNLGRGTCQQQYPGDCTVESQAHKGWSVARPKPQLLWARTPKP